MAKAKTPKRRRKPKRGRPVVRAGIPPKKKSESWVGYHDRLTKLASQAEDRGDPDLASALYAKAGRIAHLRSRVRTQPRKGRRSGPGSYPWKECIAQTEARMKRRFPVDYKQRARKVCGAIRAASQRRYPAYWKARDPGRALPARKNPALTAEELATDQSDAWIDHKGMQHVAAVEVKEQVVAIVREKPGGKQQILGGDVLIARGFASPHEALEAGRKKIDELAQMRRGKVA